MGVEMGVELGVEMGVFGARTIPIRVYHYLHIIEILSILLNSFFLYPRAHSVCVTISSLYPVWQAEESKRRERGTMNVQQGQYRYHCDQVDCQSHCLLHFRAGVFFI